MQKDAIIDTTEKYRYLLTRKRGSWNRRVNFIMLNPSTADANLDDPTIKSCLRIAQNHWFDGLKVTNLFAYRETSPKKLIDNSGNVDIIWWKNNEYLEKTASESEKVILARWNHGMLLGRNIQVLSILKDRPLYCLSVTSQRQPKHPLYVKGNAELILYK